MPISGNWRPPPDRFFGPLDRATKRLRLESNSNIIQPKKLLWCYTGFNTHFERLCSWIDCNWNILWIFKYLQNSKDFTREKKTFHIKKQSLTVQNMLSKLRATYEMNFGNAKFTAHLSVIWPWWIVVTDKRFAATQINHPTSVLGKLRSI